MIWLLSVAASAAPSAKEVETWLPKLEKMVRKRDVDALSVVFAEPLARTPPEQRATQLEALPGFLKQAMKGERDIACRGEVCRAHWDRGDETSYLLLRPVDGGFRLWDEGFGEHVAGQVTAQLAARGSGRVEVLLNDNPTWLFDPVQGSTAMVSMLDRALAPGANTITLVPTGEVTVSLRVGGWGTDAGMVDTTRGDLVTFDGELTESRTFRFEVAAGASVLPD